MAQSSSPLRLRVLLVDDDPDVGHWFTVRFADEPVELFLAPDGPTALALLSDRAVDLAIVDEVLPGMDGIQVLEQLRSRWPGVVRVMLTGHPSPDVVIGSVNQGGVHKVIPKGLDLEDAKGLLDEVINEGLARVASAGP